MRTSGLLLLVVLVAGACAGEDGDPANATPAAFESLEAGGRLPPATLDHLDGQGQLDVAELVGRPLVVNFWATWCPSCVEEMPEFERVHGDLGDEVKFVGIDHEDNHERARKLAAETGVTYELVVDPDGAYFAAVQGRGMPTTLFVSEDGRIAHRHSGPLTEEDLRAAIEEHLDVPAS